MKKLIQKMAFGVEIGCVAFVMMLYIASAFTGGANELFAQRTGVEWLKAATCFIVISLGYSISSLIYNNEKLPLGMAVLIHMMAGTLIFLAVSFFAGWMEGGVKGLLIYILLAILIAVVIWGILLFFLKKNIQKMNQKIADRKLGE